MLIIEFLTGWEDGIHVSLSFIIWFLLALGIARQNNFARFAAIILSFIITFLFPIAFFELKNDLRIYYGLKIGMSSMTYIFYFCYWIILIIPGYILLNKRVSKEFIKSKIQVCQIK